MRLRDRKIFGTEDDFAKIGCDRASEMNSGSCEFLERKLLISRTRVNIMMRIKIMTITNPPRKKCIFW